MASVPNTRVAPSPVPAGQLPAATTGPADFARQFAEIPEELLKLSAAILSGDGGMPADGPVEDGSDAATAEPADAPSDAAQLAALAPLLQSLPAIVAAPTTAPAPEIAPKVDAGEAKAPTAVLPASTPPATGKVKAVKPEAQADETGADTGNGETPPTLDAAAKEAIHAAKRTIEAALRAAGPALAEAAPKAVRAVATALHLASHTKIPTPGAGTEAPVADIAASAALAMPAAPASAPAAAIQPRETAAPAAGPASGPPLDLANDAEWLDRLARDIAQASGNEGTIRFRLHPQTLGHLRVELSQGDHGTSIRLTADTEQARAILADAQPRLVAEARAQGVRIAETHVDLSGSDRHFSGDPRRQDDFRQTPLIRTARDAATDADARPRPGRSRSDRYA